MILTLQIFAKPEREMQESQDSTSLQNVCTFLMECTRARKYIEPLPLNELPWGPTQTFYDFKLRLHNQKGPVIVTWGGKRRLVMESNETMLISYTIYDSEGMEMDTRSIVFREDSGNKITFTISPPRVGTFKLMIFGMPKPKQKGKWRLPLLATFMVDCKLIKPPQYDEDPPPPSFMPPQSEEMTPTQQRGGQSPIWFISVWMGFNEFKMIFLFQSNCVSLDPIELFLTLSPINWWNYLFITLFIIWQDEDKLTILCNKYLILPFGSSLNTEEILMKYYSLFRNK